MTVSLTRRYPNMSGTFISYQDLGRRLNPDTDVDHDRITLIGVTDGTSANWTLGEPRLLAKVDDRNDYKHADGTHNNLTKAITEAFSAGATQVEVLVCGSYRDDNVYPSTGVPGPTGLYAALDDAYDTLTAHNTDIVVPVRCLIDHTGLTATQNFAYQLAYHCWITSAENDERIGVIGVSAPNHAAGNSGLPTAAELTAWDTALAAYDTSTLNGIAFTLGDGTTDANGDRMPDNYKFYATTDGTIPSTIPADADAKVLTDPAGNPVDIGSYIVIPAEYGRFQNSVSLDVAPTLGYYYGQPDAAIAGLISTTPEYRNITGLPIPGYIPARRRKRSELNTLIGKRYTVLDLGPTGYRCVNGDTWGYHISPSARTDRTNLMTIRIEHRVRELVRAVHENYLGRANSEQNRVTLATSLRTELNRYRETTGALEDPPTIQIVSSAVQRLLDEVEIRINMRTVGEMRRFTVYISQNPTNPADVANAAAAV